MYLFYRYQLETLSTKPHSMIPLYGSILGSDYGPVRDLGAKTFTILVRKLKSKVFKSHFTRIINAVITTWRINSTTTATTIENSANDSSAIHIHDFHTLPFPEVENENFIDNLLYESSTSGRGDVSASQEQFYNRYIDLQDSFDGLSRLMLYSCKGIQGCLHSNGGEKVSALLAYITNYAVVDTQGGQNCDSSGSSVDHLYVAGHIVSDTIRRLFRHLRPSNSAELWLRLSLSFEHLISTWTQVSASSSAASLVNLSTSILVEIVIFGLKHSNGRALSDPDVKLAVRDTVVDKSVSFIKFYLDQVSSDALVDRSYISTRVVTLLCQLWLAFPQSSSLLAVVKDADLVAKCLDLSCSRQPLTIISDMLLWRSEAITDSTVQGYLMRPILAKISSMEITLMDTSNARAEESWLLIAKLLTNLAPLPFTPTFQQSSGRLSTIFKDSKAYLLTILKNSLTWVTTHTSSYITTQNPPLYNTHILAINNIKWFSAHCPELMRESALQKLIKRLHNVLESVIYTDYPSTDPVIAHAIQLYCILLTTSVNGSTSEKSKANVSKLIIKCVKRSLDDPASVSAIWTLLYVLDFTLLSPSHATHHGGVEGERLGAFRSLSEVITAESELEGRLFDALGELLSTASYWLRLGYLRLLQYLPSPSQLSGPDTLATTNEPKKSGTHDAEEHKRIADTTNITDIFLEIVKTPLQVSTQRQLSLLLGNIEVIVRSGKLPVQYQRIVCSFCLGLLHIKFSSIWADATTVLKSFAASDVGEGILWPLVLAKLKAQSFHHNDTYSKELASQSADSSIWETLTAINDGTVPVDNTVAGSFYFYCHAPTETTASATGATNSTSGGRYKAAEVSLVAVDARADTDTVYATVWRLLELCPNITLKRSRVVVPLFLK